MFDNSDAKRQLVETLRQRKHALLLIGSGSSQFVGYPSWPDLLDQLRRKVVPDDPFPDGLDLLKKASFIHMRMKSYEDYADRKRQFREHIESTFRPRPSQNYVEFHKTLLQLPFCGVATTNYDEVLEIAIKVIRSEDGLEPHCHSIDLCDERPHRVFEFLRGLSAQNPDPAVQHIHGYWQHPEKIVLTSEHYGRLYGVPGPTASPSTPELSIPDRPLDTLHRKVVWSLLAMRPVVFVGFGLRDPAFNLILRFVMMDFDLPLQPACHFALFPSHVNDQQEERQELDARRLKRFGVIPVFYPVTTNVHGHDQHAELPTLVEELSTDIGSPSGTPTLAEISRRLLERG